MKKFIFPSVLTLLLFGFIILNANISNPAEGQTLTPVTADDIVDPDLLENEIRGAVMEFIEDAGLDPDSVYIPFE